MDGKGRISLIFERRLVRNEVFRIAKSDVLQGSPTLQNLGGTCSVESNTTIIFYYAPMSKNAIGFDGLVQGQTLDFCFAKIIVF